MVTDNRSAGPTVPAEYEGYDALPIVDVKVHMLGQARSGGHGLLRVITEGGIEGWCNNLDVRAAHFIVDQFRDMLIGRDALARERIWHDLLMWERFQWSPKEVRGAIDIALWDLMGQACGQPVSRLLGGVYRDRIRPYGSMLFDEPDVLAQRLQQVVARGFKAIKLGWRPFGRRNNAFDEKLVATARETVGSEVTLLVDAGGSEQFWPHGFSAMWAY